jgi:dihydrofolate reductase
MKAGLVDQLHLLIYPIIRGTGARLFDGSFQLSLQSESIATYDNGVIASKYTLQPKN